MNVKLAIQFYKNMGPRYVKYRVLNEIEKRLGILKRKHPRNLQLTTNWSVEEWRSRKNVFVIGSREELNIKKNPSVELEQKAKKILNGEVFFFNAEWMPLGKNFNWLTNPTNGYCYDISKHWSEIADLSQDAGDIKYVWEKSRFSYLLPLIRYDYHFGIDLAEFTFSEIDSWIAANPVNHGPNWRCSQEISIRIFNWCYALYYYQNSKALTDERWYRIQQVIYASIHHVYYHIDFSRIAVRNNHAITETLLLALSSTLFPFVPETKVWAKYGLRWFEEEIDYQIYNDGTFLQFSMNYHRVVIQLLTLGISIFELNNRSFSKNVYSKAHKSLDFLYQCMQDENGWLPNYGSNDGALFFHLADSDFRDYKPQLNTLHFILTGSDLFNDSRNTEEKFWFGGKSINNKLSKLSKQYGVLSFTNGGYYLCRHDNFFTMIRCGNHKDRPAQADNLHLDVWYKGENILRDSGTYKYNTDVRLLKYFLGSESHNVVMVDEESQMLKGGRFIWYYWTQSCGATWTETETAFIFSGTIRAFQHINPNGRHERRVTIYKSRSVWTVEDRISGLDGRAMKQIWHPNHADIDFKSITVPQQFDSFNSDYYGSYTSEKSIFFSFNERIKTDIIFTIK